MTAQVNRDPDLTVADFRQITSAIEREVAKVMVGQNEVVHQLLITLLAGGNALLEGVPGLGKTLLVRTLARVIACSFARIQFTPDLMPADVLGTILIAEDENGHRSFRFEAGPIFANLVLADEINRATPKTQSALLEAMQEGQVTVAKSTWRLPRPFFVLATQNPLEMEGTYPLPEAQLDRFFFKLLVTYPSVNELMEIADRTTGTHLPAPVQVADALIIEAMQRLVRQVPIASQVTEYGARLLMATHPENAEAPDLVKRFVRYGASPRGLQALVVAAKIAALLDGRYNVAYEDIQQMALPALRHRLILNFEGQAENIDPDEVIRAALARAGQKASSRR